MSNNDFHRTNSAALPKALVALRQRAEQLLAENTVASPEDFDPCSPEALSKLHREQQVQQVMLELQNKELQQTQQALETAKAHYFELYDLAPVGYITIDEHELISQANLTAASLLGITRNALVQEIFSRFIARESIDEYRQHCKELMQTGEPQSFEFQLVRANGSVFWAQVNTTVIEEADGTPHFNIMLNDISQRKETEIALAQERFLLHALMDTMPEHVYFKDRESRFIRVSKSQSRLFSLPTPDDVIGKTDFDFFTEEHARQAYEDEKQIIQTGQAIAITERETWPAHTDTWVSSSKAPLRDENGNIVGTFGISKDITAQKLAEAELEQHRNHLEFVVHQRTKELAKARDAAEAANRAKSTFLAHMSHGLRTPLNGIVGMTELALRRATDKKQIDYLKKGADASKHLLAVINDILCLSRIEAGRLILEEHDFSLTQMIDETVQMQEHAAREKGISLHRDIAANIPQFVNGDALRLKQILLNFIANAIKFSEHGQISVHARIEEEDKYSVLLRLEVVDQGIGIDAERQTYLFEAFSHSTEPSARKYGGSGIGLNICKRLATLMGGTVGVTSQPEVGSTFWFTAHLQRSAGSASSAHLATPEAKELLAQQFSGQRILVVDDDPMTQEIALLILKEAGLVVELACDGKEALEKAQTGDYAMILMDVQMPVMNGLEATEAIRQIAGMEDTPILAMTASAFENDRQRCLAAGMNAFISKPVAPNMLCQRVLEWLTKSTGQSE